MTPTRTLLPFLLLVTAACGEGDPARSSTAQPISLGDFQGTLAAGPARVEIELVPGTLDASEIHGEADDDDEKIESSVASIDTLAGTITLELGGLVVSYDDQTRFRSGTESDIPRTDWEASVSAGTFIEIRRDLPVVPQAPDDATFAALDLRVANETDEPQLELLVGTANLAVTSATDAVLTVLGLDIAIGASTELFDDSPGSGPGADADEFEGSVTSVDLVEETLALADGTVVDTTGVTFDPEGDLFDLASVAAAVEAGEPVRAEGDGTVDANGVVLPSSLKVEVDD